MKKKFTRQELYDMVWSEPRSSLSKRFNISDVGLRKLCVKMGVPMPKHGHWARIKHGKSVTIQSLPGNYTGDETATLEIREEGMISEQAAVIGLQKKIESDDNHWEVSKRLAKPDILIAEAKTYLTRPDRRVYDGAIASSGDILNISVSPKILARALRFLNALIQILRTRGHDVRIENGDSVVIIEGQKLELSLREKFTKNPNTERWQPNHWQPRGVLSLRIKRSYHQMESIDGKLTLEQQMSKIVAKLEHHGQLAKEEHEEWGRKRAEQAEYERIRKELHDRKENELKMFKELLEKTKRWEKANFMRTYLDTMKENAVKNNTLTPDLVNMIEWGKQKADWYDPLIEREDELLADVKRAELKMKSFNAWGDW
jgi:hypothetical protein